MWVIENFKLKAVAPAKYVHVYMLYILYFADMKLVNIISFLSTFCCHVLCFISLYRFTNSLLYHMNFYRCLFFSILHLELPSFYIFTLNLGHDLISAPYLLHYFTKNLYGRYGQFYGGDSYVVLYTYKKGTKDQHMIYFWLGHSSSKDEIGEIINPPTYLPCLLYLVLESCCLSHLCAAMHG